MQRWHVDEAEGPYRVQAEVLALGEDLLVVLTGGRAHVGAVALADPDARREGPSPTGAGASVFALPGHRDDLPARELAEDLAGRLNRRTLVVAGLHWDRIDPAGIHTVLALCRRLGPAIAAKLSGAELA